eukprot:scpid33075/ scgid9996/ 
MADQSSSLPNEESTGSCAICGEHPEQGRVLPCKHACCLQCLENGKTRPARLHKRRSYKVRCPLCQAKHLTKTVSAFPRVSVDAQSGVKSISISAECKNHPNQLVQAICNEHCVGVCEACIQDHQSCSMTLPEAWSSKGLDLRKQAVTTAELTLIPLCRMMVTSEENFTALRKHIQHVEGEMVPNPNPDPSKDEFPIRELHDMFDTEGAEYSDHSTLLCREVQVFLDLFTVCEKLLTYSRDDIVEQTSAICSALLRMKKMASAELATSAWERSHVVEYSDYKLIIRDAQRGTYTAPAKPKEAMSLEDAATAFSDLHGHAVLLKKDIAQAIDYTLTSLLRWKSIANTMKSSHSPGGGDTPHGGLISASQLKQGQQRYDQRQQQAKRLNAEQNRRLSEQGQQADALRRKRQESTDRRASESVLSQGQRADKLRRQRQEQLEEQRLKIQQARKEEEERQEQRRRKAQEALEKQKQDRLEQERKMQAEIERQREKQRSEKQRREEIRQQHQEKQLQQHAALKQDRAEKSQRMQNEQRSVLEDFQRQQHAGIQQQHQSLQERSEQHHSLRLEQEDQVHQVLQRQQEKKKQTTDTHQAHQHLDDDQLDLQKRHEEKQQQQQQMLIEQRGNDAQREQRLRDAMASKKQQQEYQLRDMVEKHHIGEKQMPRLANAVQDVMEMQRRQNVEHEERIKQVLGAQDEKKRKQQEQQQGGGMDVDPVLRAQADKKRAQQEELVQLKLSEEKRLQEQIEKKRQHQQAVVDQQQAEERQHREQVLQVLRHQPSLDQAT